MNYEPWLVTSELSQVHPNSLTVIGFGLQEKFLLLPLASSGGSCKEDLSEKDMEYLSWARTSSFYRALVSCCTINISDVAFCDGVLRVLQLSYASMLAVLRPGRTACCSRPRVCEPPKLTHS